MVLEILHGFLMLLRRTPVENVPRLRRFPVLAFFLREYKRYSPVFIFRII